MPKLSNTTKPCRARGAKDDLANKIRAQVKPTNQISIYHHQQKATQHAFISHHPSQNPCTRTLTRINKADMTHLGISKHRHNQQGVFGCQSRLTME